MPRPEEMLPETILLQAFMGLKNTVAPERLAPTDLERATNIDIDDTGQIRRRRGYDLKLAGSFHSVRDIAGKTYGVKDGSLGIVRADYSFSTLLAVGTAPVCYTEVDEKVYFCNASSAGVVEPNETISPWGATSGQGVWLSPVIDPTPTLGEVAGRLLGDPLRATQIEAYKGRIYLAVGKVLWATELFLYHYVDRTRNFMQFEHDIVMLQAVEDGIYVGTTGGLYFIQGVFGAFRLSQISSAPVVPGSGVRVPTDLVHPQARNGPVPTGEAAVLMTADGIVACFDSGSCFNLTHGRMVFPKGISSAALFRQQDGVNAYVAAVESAGGMTSTARIGDYVEAEIIRAADR